MSDAKKGVAESKSAVSITIPSDESLRAAVLHWLQLPSTDFMAVTRKQCVAEMESAHQWDLSDKKVRQRRPLTSMGKSMKNGSDGVHCRMW